MPLKLKTAPDGAPVSIDDVRLHLRIDHNDDDTLLDLLISAAVSYMDGREGVVGRAMFSQVWELYCDAFPAGDMEIPLGPVSAVSKIEYLDTLTGLYVDWPSAGNWTADFISDPARLIPTNGWPSPKDAANAVRVTFTAGFGEAGKVPAALKAAMLLLIGDWYENREASVDKPFDQQRAAFKALVAPFRRRVI